MGWNPAHGRIKRRYRPIPTARERAFHEWAYTDRQCVCCDAPATVFHHLLQDTPSKRWRRDHEIGVAMNGMCHMLLHRKGRESAYRPDIDWASEAEALRQRAYDGGIL